MKKLTKITVLFSILVFVLSACSVTQQVTDTSGSPTEEMMENSDMNSETKDNLDDKNMDVMEEETMDTMSDDSMGTTQDEEMMEDHSESMDAMDDNNMESETEDSVSMMADTPEWFQIELKDENTGETFSIDDFHGKVVLVETMAIWCTNCKKQQNEVKSLYETMGMNSDLVFIALDIDPNENGEALKEYASVNNFSWVYAISPVEMSREISNLYGAQFVNPPSTPILIVDREGVAHPLEFGIKSVEDHQSAIDTYLNDM